MIRWENKVTDFDVQLLLWRFACFGQTHWTNEIWEGPPDPSIRMSFGGHVMWDQDESVLENCTINDERCPDWFALPYVAQWAHERGIYATDRRSG